ncbi:hypothetical protein AAVH_03127 [Aphelenchoides avenae]|nr:hypothetical protein AAVH_03127 [Aphelenchus avenae]
MLGVGTRYMFNLEQIEKRYCGPNHISTGIVMDPKTGEESYDPDLCNAKDDEEHLQAVKNLHAMLVQGPVLSTPELDPEETDKEKIKLWKKMNKEFEKYCKDQSALVPVKNRNLSETRMARRSHPYAKPQLALPSSAGASSSKGSPWTGSLKVNRLHGSPFNNSASHTFKAPLLPPKKYLIHNEPVAAHLGGTSSMAMPTFPKPNTRSSLRAIMPKSGKQPQKLEDGTASIRSGFLIEVEPRNEVALRNTGPRIAKQPRMANSLPSEPAPKIQKTAYLKNWVLQTRKDTAMKNIDS